MADEKRWKKFFRSPCNKSPSPRIPSMTGDNREMLTAAINTMEHGAGADRALLDRLLRQVADGDREAFGQLYRLARGPVYGLVLSMLKNAHDAQEITQDTFVKVWDSAGSYRSQGSPMAWLLTVARNLARMRLRQSARLGELTEEEWEAIPADAPAVTAEDRAVLQEALASLGDQERQIVLLHAASGLKHREIASLLELPLSTVLSKYQRALKKLRAQLEGGGIR